MKLSKILALAGCDVPAVRTSARELSISKGPMQL